MAKLTAAQLDAFGTELDSLRQEVLDDLGQRDADHIRSMVRRHRYAEIGGRTLIHFSIDPFTWAAGVGLLTSAKILENMEIGHNVMHGQYDWMNDPTLNSQTYEWDAVSEKDSWRRTHNYEHHTYTNIIGKDRDFGYGLLRMSDDEPWRPDHLWQILKFASLSAMFQWGVAVHEMEWEKISTGEKSLREKLKPVLIPFWKKSAKQLAKVYVVFPLLAGPFAPKVIAGNFLANFGRNIWASSIIFCGHFPEGVHTFTEEECKNESRGHWYYRQLLGSCNFRGKRWLHIMSGHLSYQIEHHLFPDIPAHRYPEIAPRVEALCAKYGLPYNSDTFFNQYKTVLTRILRYSLPPEVRGKKVEPKASTAPVELQVVQAKAA